MRPLLSPLDSPRGSVHLWRPGLSLAWAIGKPTPFPATTMRKGPDLFFEIARLAYSLDTRLKFVWIGGDPAPFMEKVRIAVAGQQVLPAISASICQIMKVHPNAELLNGLKPLDPMELCTVETILPQPKWRTAMKEITSVATESRMYCIKSVTTMDTIPPRME